MTMSNDLDPRFTPAQQRAMRGERFPCECGYDGPGWEGRTRCAHCGGERDDITWRLKSSELRRGDIVHCHGMNVLIDGTPTQYGGAQGLPAYRYRGLVLNRAEVSEEDVPRAYTAPDDRWTIQGNDVARWVVRRTRALTSDPQTTQELLDRRRATRAALGDAPRTRAAAESGGEPAETA